MSLVISTLALGVSLAALAMNFFYINHNLRISIADQMFDEGVPPTMRHYGTSVWITVVILNAGNRPETILSIALILTNKDKGIRIGSVPSDAIVVAASDSKPIRLELPVDTTMQNLQNFNDSTTSLGLMIKFLDSRGQLVERSFEFAHIKVAADTAGSKILETNRTSTDPVFDLMKERQIRF